MAFFVLRARLITLAFMVLLALACAAHARFQDTDQAKKVRELALYQGEDRLERLLEGARREGALNIYTSQALDTSGPIVEAFKRWMHAEHGIHVETQLWRGNSEAVVQRIIFEAEAGAFNVDVIEDLNSPRMEILGRAGVLSPFWSPLFDGYPEWARDPKGLWHATRWNFIVAAYNTDLIKPEELPRSYEDLLHPRWKGRLGIESTNWYWLSALVDQGPFDSREEAIDFFRKLRAQGPQLRAGATLLAQLVSAGEIPLALTVYNYRVQINKDEGAPVEWFPLEPVVAQPNATALLANARNPHTALLFIDFLLSKEAQELIRELKSIPAHPSVPANPPRLRDGFEYVIVDAESIADHAETWEKLWNDVIIAGRE